MFMLTKGFISSRSVEVKKKRSRFDHSKRVYCGESENLGSSNNFSTNSYLKSFQVNQNYFRLPSVDIYKEVQATCLQHRKI